MKIFQIGFNKCATKSMFKFFMNNKIPSVHWETNDGINVALHATNNLNSGRKAFDGLDFTFYSDMEFTSYNKAIYLYEQFQTIDEQYPDSKFIFNTRDVDDWVKSRLNHHPRLMLSYVDRAMKYYKCGRNKVIKKWKDHYNKHTDNVLEYFSDKPNKLLHFKLGESTTQDIADFLPEFHFDDLNFPWANKSEQNDVDGL